MSPDHKPIDWIHGEVKTPPMSDAARTEIGYLLRQVQGGVSLPMPQSRPMPSIGARCHELRVQDETKIWRVIYRIDERAVVVFEVFHKTTQQTPTWVITACKQRIKRYDVK